ncbi:hypothetical protein GCM10009555_063950 [Acrocarpospora macrocephala]|uniref:P/Homo B domain-containing protein n=1 Tax=Acrocarpospora macrocephala TaxID=150177 RepID=A0A5M3WH97_9ACTN|nr:hypothetical protein [Acrocarpospora macrocephala]GES07670.1 hypothetical protein Amac_012650 [Acrocarpospora macrocephala]
MEIVPLLGAFVLTLGVATPALADPDISSVRISPTTVEVSQSKRATVTVKVKVVDADSVTATASSRDGADEVTFGLFTEYTEDYWTGIARIGGDMPTGAWTLQITATDGDTTTTTTRTFWVKRKTATTLVATKTSVPKGAKVKLYGHVYRITSDADLRHKLVRIYYRKSGTTAWHSFTSVRTDGTGYFEKTIRPKFDAKWMAVSVATNTYAKSESPAKFIDTWPY